MKTRIAKDNTKEPFKPVTVEITFETQRELDLFASLCNSTYITDAIERMSGAMPDYDVLLGEGAYINFPSDILQEILDTPAMKAAIEDRELKRKGKI